MEVDGPSYQPVVNPLPPVVAAMAMAIFAVELLLWAGARGYVGGPAAVGWRLEAIRDFGFFAQVLEQLVDRGWWFSEENLRLLTYPFIHLGFTHMVMVCVFLLALGKLVGEVFGSLAVIVTFVASAIVGALAFAWLTGAVSPLVGGFPAVYGLIGSYTFLLWMRLGQMRKNQYLAFQLIGFLLAIQLVFGALFGASYDWVAELAGFATGFALAPVLAPGGFGRLRDRLRQR